MKTGRPNYYIPSPTTVSQDVKKVFANAQKRIAKMLREHEGRLNFATDAWTSPNHKAFVAVTVHFEKKGTPIALLLDLVEVPKSHSGENLAAAFTQIMEEFDICDKVNKNEQNRPILSIFEQILSITCDNASANNVMIDELADLLSRPGPNVGRID
jgi:hypothetical protein